MAVAATGNLGAADQPAQVVDAVERTRKFVRVFDNTDVAASCTYTWEVRDWMNLGERAVSPEFECGNQRWRILLFPQGNPNGHPKSHVALYLEALGPHSGDASADSNVKERPGATKRSASDVEFDLSSPIQSRANSESSDSVQSSENHDWPHTCASFAMSMWNPQHPDVHVTQATNHRYTPSVRDWGYNEFIFMRSAFVRRQDDTAAIIAPVGSEYDASSLGVNITVAIDVLKDPTGVLWHDFTNYDSRAETGYTGLVNQGATCYLNSLLQSLYFTKVFRNAVYRIPDSKGVTGGLQRLFYMLSTSQPPVDTTSLTRAFGWDSADAFTQHDVQELARVLMDRLESKMKGTAVDGVLSRIFVGEMKSYIKCQNVPFESSRTEEFWDVQLNVRGMRDVMESFRAYCAEELLEGDNQYAAGEYGLQDAVKGVVFRTFPPVLHLQLKRYDYDWMHDVEVKINDRYEFPLELDLTEFTESKSGDWRYALHGVLVHSGDLNVGHYYALIKPNANGGWFKFDDERVVKATLREVLEENFGGDGQGLRRVTSAYMLVYVRVSQQDFVLGGSDSIPLPVTEQIEAEEKKEALVAKALAEQQQLLTVSVLNASTLKHHQGPGLYPWSSRIENEFETPQTTKVRIGTPIEKFIRDLNTGSLWLVEPPTAARASRKHSRPRALPLSGYPVEQFAWAGKENLIVIAADAGDPSTSRLLFIKTWDGKELRVRESRWVDAGTPLTQALEGRGDKRIYLESLASTKQDSSLPFEPLDASLTPEKLELVHGDMLIIAETGGLEKYFETVSNSVGLHVVLENVDNGGYLVEVTKLDGYSTIVEKISTVIGLDQEYIQLHTRPSQHWLSVAIHSSGSNLDQLFACDSDPIPVCLRILPVPLTEFEQLSEVVIFWLPEGYLGREGQKQVLAAPSRECPPLSETNEQIILTEKTIETDPSQVVWIATYNRRARELERATVGSLAAAQAEGYDIFAATLPPSELRAREAHGVRLVTAFHFSQTPMRTHSVPFQFAVVPGELFKKTKERLFELLRKETDRGLEKIRFAIVTEHEATYIDDEIVLSEVMPDNASLGLDHPDRRRSVQQQAIHID